MYQLHVTVGMQCIKLVGNYSEYVCAVFGAPLLSLVKHPLK